MSALERYCFLTGWFDVHAQLTREYQLFYYPSDNTIEMFDVKQRRTFLKRTVTDLKLEDLYIGAAVNVFSRQLSVQGYGDEFTKKELTEKMERTFVLIKANAYKKMGEIIDEILGNEFTICQLKLVDMTSKHSDELLRKEYSAHPKFTELKASIEGRHIVAMELMKINAVAEMKVLAGPETVEESKSIAPFSIHARFGASGYKNGLYCSSSYNNAKQEINFIFGTESSKKFRRLATFENSTLAIIKPHATNAGLSGQIISAILKEGFYINDMELFRLEKANAEEFLEVYKGVVPEYHLMLEHLTSGHVIAMEIQSTDGKDSSNPSIVTKFREFVGPIDPELGKQIRPKSLRAKFGIDKVRNAIHCTDLIEDGVLETQYFFRILVE